MNEKIKKEKNYNKGFTLIEILVALAILAFTSIVAIPAIRGVFEENLKSSSRKLAGTIKFLYNESILKNKTMRLVYDFENNEYWGEFAGDNFMLIEKEDKSIFNDPEDIGEHEFTKSQNKIVQSKALSSGVKFIGVCSTIKGEMVREGRAYTHFFANGVVESTIIYIGYDEKIYTLEIEPMLGYAKIYDQYEESSCNEK